MARLRILFAVSECVPWAKTGGLADVAGALPIALRRRGHDVRVVMPRYRVTQRLQTHRMKGPLGVDTGVGTRWCAVHEARLSDDVPLYLIEHDALYDRSGLYGDVHGAFGDNCLRYALLSRAALAIRGYLGFQPDVVHVHDWQTSMIPVDLAARRERLATVLTIHNLGYQGVFGLDAAQVLGHALEDLKSFGVEHFGTLNLLKGGIRNATQVATVSPRYAAEVCLPEGGAGLDGELRLRGSAFTGILNGIDDEVWDPATDPHLSARYDATDTSNKAVCKAALQRQMGLPVDPAVPLVGLVGRFVTQKGIDVIVEALPRLVESDVQFVFLGSGEPWAEEAFERAAMLHPNVSVHVGYSEELAHRIEAGADYFLMPSRYEPCGLNQLYSQRYGTPPIVRAVGGLIDTVDHEVTGIVFGELTADRLVHVVRYACALFRDRPEVYRTMQIAGMTKRSGWDEVATQYEALYRLAVRKTASRP